MGSLRTASATIGLTATLVLASLPAGAQGTVCLELEARLVQIERASAPGDFENLRQYDTSIAQQRNEIDRATAEARRAGCVGGFLIFKPRAEPKCPQLMATIDQMRAILQRLMQARGQSGGDPFAQSRDRSEILRSLAMNNCGPQYSASGGFGQPDGLLQTLFGQPRLIFPDSGGFGRVGAYRTLCVRTCDGYYFPISFSTFPGKFAADAATCQQMCPGTAAVLYVHRNPGEEASAMVSLDGQPYTALPTAFRYRQQYDKSCTCGSPAAPAFMEFSTAAAPPVPDLTSETSVSLPGLRPTDPGEDPETLANRAGRLDPTSVPPTETAEPGSQTPDGRKIRIVGPVDFYAQ